MGAAGLRAGNGLPPRKMFSKPEITKALESRDSRAFLQRSQPGGSYTRRVTPKCSIPEWPAPTTKSSQSVDHALFGALYGLSRDQVACRGSSTRLGLWTRGPLATCLFLCSAKLRRATLPNNDGCRRASTTVFEALAPTRERVGWLLLSWFTRYAPPPCQNNVRCARKHLNILLVARSLHTCLLPESCRHTLGRPAPPVSTRSVLVVSHHLDGLHRATSAGLLHPADGLEVRLVSHKHRQLPKLLTKSAIPATL